MGLKAPFMIFSFVFFPKSLTSRASRVKHIYTNTQANNVPPQILVVVQLQIFGVVFGVDGIVNGVFEDVVVFVFGVVFFFDNPT